MLPHYRSGRGIFLVILEAFKKSAKPDWLHGGGIGIQTQGRFITVTGFQDRRIKPNSAIPPSCSSFRAARQFDFEVVLSTTQAPMSMMTLYFGLSYEAVMPTTNSQLGDGAPFASHQLSSKRRQCDNLCPSFFILARAVSESVAMMQRPDGCEPRHSI